MACKHPPLPNKPGTNWIERRGGLPEMIDCVARALHHERGKSVSSAVQIAIGVVRNWASGKGDVKPSTRIRAAAAVARYEAMRRSAGK